MQIICGLRTAPLVPTTTPTQGRPPVCPATTARAQLSWQCPGPRAALAAHSCCARQTQTRASSHPSSRTAAFPGERSLLWPQALPDPPAAILERRHPLLLMHQQRLLSGGLDQLALLQSLGHSWAQMWQSGACPLGCSSMPECASCCRGPSRPYSMAGDAGALVSIGLLRSIPFADMEECILKQWSTGGPLSLVTPLSVTCVPFVCAVRARSSLPGT